MNWLTKDCWFYLNGICVFGKKCFNNHPNKNERFRIHDHQQENGPKKKIYNSKSSKIVNKQFVSRTNQIKFRNVKENNEERQTESVGPTKNTKNGQKYESYSILKKEMKRLITEVKYLKNLVQKMRTNQSSNESTKETMDGLEPTKEGVEKDSTNVEEKCQETKHPDFWENLARMGRRK